MNDEQPLLVDTGRGFTIRYRGRLLYSPVDPQQAARRRSLATQAAPRTLLFVPSVGLGYGLPELLHRLPEECHILCVEADQPLMHLAATGPVRLPSDPRLHIIRTEAPEEALAVLHRIGIFRFRRVQPVHLCGGYHLHRRTYEEIRGALEEELRIHWQNKITLIGMSRLWVRNLLRNLALLPRSGSLSELAGSTPLAVLGAGPSLQVALETVRRLRGELTVVAVDTALPVLGDAGLQPDWVVTVEAQQANLEDFIPFRTAGTGLICDLTANPCVLRLFARRLFFCSRFHPLSLFDRLEALGLLPTVLPPLGSVGVAAVQAALGMTSGPIVVAGLDFAYLNGQTHARGAPPHRRMLREANRLRPVGQEAFQAILQRPLLRLPGKDRGPVLTDLVLRTYARQLQRRLAGRGGVYDLGGAGLATGAEAVGSPARLRRLLQGRTRPSRTAPAGQARPGRPQKPPRPREEAVRALYRQEMALLEAARQAMRELLALPEAAREGSGREAAAREGLRRVEYAFLDFPESDPRAILSAGYLRRGLLAAAVYRDFLKRLAATPPCS